MFNTKLSALLALTLAAFAIAAPSLHTIPINGAPVEARTFTQHPPREEVEARTFTQHPPRMDARTFTQHPPSAVEGGSHRGVTSVATVLVVAAIRSRRRYTYSTPAPAPTILINFPMLFADRRERINMTCFIRFLFEDISDYYNPITKLKPLRRTACNASPNGKSRL
ncbi:hypothetical protein B0H19DRAFT_1083925 [Mycena capillaripes]|nr:hypothetical protein B0H19DRAFT_1083925 [Mycena capillaripes]